MVKMLDDGKLDKNALRNAASSLSVVQEGIGKVKSILEQLSKPIIVGHVMLFSNRREGEVGLLIQDLTQLQAEFKESNQKIKDTIKTLKRSLINR